MTTKPPQVKVKSHKFKDRIMMKKNRGFSSVVGGLPSKPKALGLFFPSQGGGWEQTKKKIKIAKTKTYK